MLSTICMLSYFTEYLGFCFNINTCTKEFTAWVMLQNSTLRNQYYKVAACSKNNYSKHFLFSTPSSSFGLPSLLLPSCFLTHFVGVSVTLFCTLSGWRRTWAANSDTCLRRYRLMLLESISYYLGWRFASRPGMTLPFFANSSSCSQLCGWA